MAEPNRIEVDATALRQVLQALVGPSHMVREVQATMNLHDLMPNPIVTLLNEYAVWHAQQPRGDSSNG